METVVERPAVPTEVLPERARKLARSWFWIVVISFVGMLSSQSSTSTFFRAVSENSANFPVINGFECVAAAVGILFVPMLLDRLGVFADPRKYRTFLIGMSSFGVLAILGFTLILGENPNPEIMWAALIFQFCAMIVPSVVMGCVLRRAAKVLSGKNVAWLSGLVYMIFVSLVIAHSLFTSIFPVYLPFVGSHILVYGLLLAIPVFVLIRSRDDFTTIVPREIESDFAKALFLTYSPKWLVIYIAQILLSTFGSNLYYAGGNYDDFTIAFQVAMFLISLVAYFVAALLMSRDKWLPIMVGGALLSLLQDGMILFFNDIRQLAVAYQIIGAVTLATGIFSIYIPLMFCIQKRNKGVAVSFFFALNFLLIGLKSFLTASPAPGLSPGLSVLSSPALGFLVCLCYTGALFYFYHDYTRRQTRELVDSIRKGQVQQNTPQQTIDSLMLTPREKELAGLLLTGEAQKNIAAKMGVSYSTVRFHSNNLYRKLNIQSRAELFALFSQPVPEATEDALSQGNSIGI